MRDESGEDRMGEEGREGEGCNLVATCIHVSGTLFAMLYSLTPPLIT